MIREWLLVHASRQTRHCLTGDNRSWCAHAWENRDRPFWRAWVRVWGADHCRKSFDFYARK